MRSLRVSPVPFVAVFTLLVVGCADADPPTALSPEDALSSLHGGGPAAASRQFVAPMSGAQEVAEVPVETLARGQTTFKLSKDGTELSYRLIVANLHDVTMAHIHLAPAGVNGPVVVWLYPSAPPPEPIPGRSSGVLATGVITEANLVGPLAGGTMADLIEAMSTGNAYVNVHTDLYPAGEIRGQIR